MGRTGRLLRAKDALLTRAAQARLAEKEIRRLKLALDQSPATVLVTGLDGTIEYVNATIAPVLDGQGQITSFVAVKEDVTEPMRTEAELKAAKNAAEAASQAKSTFLNNMSHELRTPLNAALGFIHLLQDTSLTPQQREYLDKAGVSAEHLHGIISDILDFTKIEAGRLALEDIPFDPREILGGLAGTLAQQAAEKGLRLSVEADPDLPARMLGDPVRLGQVLLNLGSNAVKFTDRGQVTVVAQVLGRDRGRVRVRFEVCDTGIGLTGAQVADLFQPFTQVDASSTRRFGGTGLGLAISLRLTRLMGGEIEVSSRPGEGSRFALVLAFREAAMEAGSPGREPVAGPVQGVDLAGTMDRLELDRETCLRLLRRLAEGQTEELAGLRAALAREDPATALRHAHSMKGAALNLGAEALGGAARDLESFLLGGGGAAWPEQVERVQDRLRELVDSLALLPDPEAAAAPGGTAPPAWPAILAALETLRQALREDDAKAGQHLSELAALSRGTPLWEALAPMKARIQNYDYGQALALFPDFLAKVEAMRAASPRPRSRWKP